jgi:hypothetical protein
MSVDSILGNAKTAIDKLIDDAGTEIKKLYAPTPAPTPDIYDTLSNTFDFHADGEVSASNKWQLGYHGENPVDSTDVGKVGITQDTSGRFANVIYEQPYFKANTTPVWGQPGGKTSASLVISQQEFADFDAEIYMRTLKSLRTPKANPWEVAWFGWHFNLAGYTILQKGAHFHHYYIMVHNNGVLEFGRKDNTTQTEHQYTLPTLVNSASFAYGVWNKVRVNTVGNHIQIWVDDKQVVDLVDDGKKGTPATDITLGPAPHPPSNFMYKGRIWLYNEDASVQFGPLKIKPIA